MPIGSGRFGFGIAIPNPAFRASMMNPRYLNVASRPMFIISETSRHAVRIFGRSSYLSIMRPAV